MSTVQNNDFIQMSRDCTNWKKITTMCLFPELHQKEFPKTWLAVTFSKILSNNIQKQKTKTKRKEWEKKRKKIRNKGEGWKRKGTSIQWKKFS